MRLVLVLLLASGCATSYYVQSGEVALEQGDHRRAMADFHMAASGEPEGSDRRAEAQRRFEEAAAAWVREEVREARGLPLERGIDRLWRIADAPWLPGRLRSDLLAVVEELTLALWPEAVEAAAERGHPVAAVHSARALTARFPPGHRIFDRLRRVEAAAAAEHARLASERADFVNARLLHTRLADYAAGTSRWDSNALADDHPIQWRVAPLVDDCGWVAEQLADALGGDASDAVAVSLTVDACPRARTSSIEEEPTRYPDQEPYLAQIDEPVLAPGAPCPEGDCLRRDPLGTCVERRPSEPCAPGEPTWETRRVTVRRFRQVTVEGVREVHQVRLAVAVRGVAHFVWDQEPVELPFAVELEETDRAFWSPAEQQQFRGTTVDDVARRVVAQVAERLREFRDQRVRRKGALLVQRGQAAADGGDHAAAEDHYFGSVRALGALMAPAREYFARRYGLRAGTLIQIARGQVPAAPPPRRRVESIGEASKSARAQERVLAPIRAKDVDAGPGRSFANRLDLTVTAEQSPLGHAEWATGVAATVRGGDGQIWLRWSLETPNLGGDARGFGLEVRGGEEIGPGLAFVVGLAYREQRNDHGERLALATLPLTLLWAPTPWLVLDADVRLNVLKLIEWASDRRGDPDFGSPVSIGVTLQSQRVFLGLRGTTWLGADTEQVVYGGGAVGVQL